MQTIVYILPEIFLSLAIMFLLMLGVFIKKSFKLVYLLTILSLIFAIALVLNQPNEIVKVPTKIKNSPTKPLVPGNPSAAKTKIINTKAYFGIIFTNPP